MKKTIIILGVNGCLGSFLANSSDFKKNDIFGFDIHPESPIDHLKNYMVCDLRNKSSISKVLKCFPLNVNKEVVIISTVGIFSEETFKSEEFNEERFYESVQVNLLGVAHFLIYLLNKIIRNHIKAKVIIVGSAASSVGSRDIAYGISKSGLNGLVISLSKSLATKDITIVGVNPGIFNSSMSNNVSNDRQTYAINSTHIKRRGNIEEIANLINYITFTSPDYLGGSIININGGQYA